MGKTGRIKFENYSLVDYIALQLKHTVSDQQKGKHWKTIGSWDQENKLNISTEKVFEVSNRLNVREKEIEDKIFSILEHFALLVFYI